MSFDEPPLMPPGPEEDVVIAQALRRSLAALVILAVTMGLAVWWLSRPSAKPRAESVAGRSSAAPGATPQVPVPRVRFTDITAASGIRFIHENGARGDKFLPETMGGGVAFLDFDNDGDQDLLLVNGGWWPGDPRHGREPAPVPALYANDGKGHFEDVTAATGLAVSFYGMGVACGDYDNDGLVDILFTTVGGVRLFHNLGGRFEERTSQAGLAGGGGDWSTAAAWIDIDNDGYLDLFVGNYVRWTPELDREVNNQLVGVGRAYGRPWNFPGSFPRLYRNDGRGRFTDVTAASGLQIRNPASGLPMAKTLAVAPIDLNGDGWMDLVVANDTVQNFAFTNRGNGTFREAGASMGIAFDAYGQARGAMGIDAARFRDGDDSVGIAIGNFANEMNALYVSQPDRLLFADEAITSGLGPASRLLLKFGLFFFDYDLDGRLDVLTANGHIEEEVEKVQADVRYRQPAQLFWNAGGASTFVPVDADAAGPDLFRPMVGRGSAFADLDGDGDLDVVMTQVHGPPRLLRNDLSLHHHWVRLKLVGRRNNRDAIGAWATLRVGGRRLFRQVMPTRSYLSQSELPLTFGLGMATAVEALEITWPGDRTTRHKIPPLDRMTVIEEPD